MRFATLLFGVTVCLGISACEIEGPRRHHNGDEYWYCYSNRDCPTRSFCSWQGICESDGDGRDRGGSSAGNSGTGVGSAGAAGTSEAGGATSS
ncbi:MAG TPA: hypothetical protein VHV51_02360, partial [Polyangiaceae bacterium]|nr:hypothetical protein [Polyangiaceae bacterium]